MIKTDLPL